MDDIYNVKHPEHPLLKISFFFRPVSLNNNAVAIDYRFVTATLCSTFLSLAIAFYLLSLALTKDWPFVGALVSRIVAVDKIYLYRDTSRYTHVHSARACNKSVRDNPFNCSYTHCVLHLCLLPNKYGSAFDVFLA